MFKRSGSGLTVYVYKWALKIIGKLTHNITNASQILHCWQQVSMNFV